MYFLDFSKNSRLLPKTLGKTYMAKCECGALVQTNGLLDVTFECPKCTRALWVCDFCGWRDREACSCDNPRPCTLSRLHLTIKARTDVVFPVLALPTLEES